MTPCIMFFVGMIDQSRHNKVRIGSGEGDILGEGEYVEKDIYQVQQKKNIQRMRFSGRRMYREGGLVEEECIEKEVYWKENIEKEV